MPELHRYTFTPFQNLIIAARAVAAGQPGAVDTLNAALRSVDESFRDQANAATHIETARKGATDDLEIDDDPMVSWADGGVWVNAWVWIDDNQISHGT